jgi:uncharacterized membrane protein YeiB
VLLFIALANVSIYVYGRTLEPGHRPVGGTSLDNALDVLVSTVVDRRSYPMFALLFGYGMVQLIRRQAASGAPWPDARRVLVRRNLFLILFGAVHAVLLFEGDILGPYGGIGLIVTLLFLRRSTRVLAVWVGVTVLVLGLVLGSGDAFTAGLTPEGESDYLASVAERLLIWSSTTVIVTLVLGLLAPTLIGVLMARAELLDRPWDHLTTLRRMAGIGIPVGLLGGLPFALTVGGYWNPGGLVNGLLGMLHSITGVAAGAGYVALFGLWAAGRRDLGRTGAVAALAATGERSLTCYLWQSLLLAPVLSAWGLGLGDEIGQRCRLRVGAQRLGVERPGGGRSGPGRPPRPRRDAAATAHLRAALSCAGPTAAGRSAPGVVRRGPASTPEEAAPAAVRRRAATAERPWSHPST